MKPIPRKALVAAAVAAALGLPAYALAQQSPAEILKQADRNRDGIVDRQEAEAVDIDIALFERADRNKDQRLDKNELARLEAQGGQQAQGGADITVDQAQPRITVQETEPRVTVDQPQPKVEVQQPEPKVTVQQPEPKVTVQQPEPKVTVQQPEPKVTVQQPEPKVTVQQPEPKVTVQQPEPKVTVQQPEPQVQVQQPKPEVTVQQPKPEVQIQEAKPQVQVTERGQPQVQVQRGEPQVQVTEQGQPQVQVQDQGKPQVQVTEQGQPQVEVQEGEPQVDVQRVQEPDVQVRQQQEQPRQAGAALPPQLGSMRVREIENMTVTNRDGQPLGDVEQVVVERDSNRPYVIIGAGGLLGLGETLVPLELDRLEPTGDGQLRSNIVVSEDELAERRDDYDENRYRQLEDDRTLAEVLGAGGDRQVISFSALDRNADGFITWEEGRADPALRERWQDLDRNADRRLDQSEFAVFEEQGQ